MKALFFAALFFVFASLVSPQETEGSKKGGNTMYLVREVFHTKPGKAKELVKKFKQAAPYFEKQGMKGFKVMTDIATTYWTVVLEYEVEDLADFAKEVRGGTSQPDVEKIMEGYMDLVEGGYREIFLIE